MNTSHSVNDDLARMWQEAEHYEAQGLYDHAILVYQNILTAEPASRKAQAKIVHLQFVKTMEETTESRRPPYEEFSPRLALDLGVAYMGMSLYEEALEEFKKALTASPAFRTDLFRYSATCLIRLENGDEALRLLDQILTDGTLSPAEKGDLISDLISVCIEQGLPTLANNLLGNVSDEQKRFVPDLDQILDALSSAGAARDDFEVLAEDIEAGKAVHGPVSISSPDAEAKGKDGESAGSFEEESCPEIPLMAPVSYSLDNKIWKEGISERLSYGWAMLDLPDTLDPGATAALKIHLPFPEGSEPVRVIARVSESVSEKENDEKGRVKAQFVSFAAGGETALKTFIDRAIEDPSVLDETAVFATSMFSELEIDAVRAMETDLLPDLGKETELLSGEEVEVGAGLSRTRRQTDPRIRFACECGHVHVVPTRYFGRKGKCVNCGRIMTVPNADTRPDSLCEQLIGQTIGGCRLFYKIGGGGMGGVFKGHHIALDIPVAVKVLHAHLADKDPIFVKRFIREARSAAKLQHPNIVGVMNVGLENGHHFLVMPYVDGGNAASMLARVGRFPVDKVLQIANDITSALSVAEENNILHRDIKPANILFTKKGEARLADLGLAKNYLDSQDSGITQTGISCGTPLYFSPEQAKGSRTLDIRSDFYSLGITLYHLLSGSPPFHGESAYVIFQKHVHEPLPPFKDFQPPVPDSMFKLLQKMAAKDPNDRFANTQELQEALKELEEKLNSMDTKTKKGLLERLGIRRRR
ncbi:MAG: protein kinase [Desulfomonilaceae bacterium]